MGRWAPVGAQFVFAVPNRALTGLDIFIMRHYRDSGFPSTEEWRGFLGNAKQADKRSILNARKVGNYLDSGFAYTEDFCNRPIFHFLASRHISLTIGVETLGSLCGSFEVPMFREAGF